VNINSNYIYITLSFLAVGFFCWKLYKYWQKDPNSIVIGVAADYPPFAYEENGTLKGFDIDLATKIVEKLGKKIVFKKMEFPLLQNSLRSGKIDMVVSGISPTDARREIVDFSAPYFSDHYCVLLRDKKISSLNDLKGQQTGVQTGSLVEGLVRSKWSLNFGFKVVSYNTNEQILQALKAGHLQGLFIALAEGKALAKNNSDLVCKTFPELQDANEELAVALAKFSPLTAQVNSILKTLQDDGILNQLKQKHGLIEQDVTENKEPIATSDEFEDEEAVFTESEDDADEETEDATPKMNLAEEDNEEWSAKDEAEKTKDLLESKEVDDSMLFEKREKEEEREEENEV